jgi:hypothetical protein
VRGQLAHVFSFPALGRQSLQICCVLRASIRRPQPAAHSRIVRVVFAVGRHVEHSAPFTQGFSSALQAVQYLFARSPLATYWRHSMTRPAAGWAGRTVRRLAGFSCTRSRLRWRHTQPLALGLQRSIGGTDGGRDRDADARQRRRCIEVLKPCKRVDGH